MDRNVVLAELFRDARAQIRNSKQLRFTRTGEGFDDLAQRALDFFYEHLADADEHYAEMAAEIFPRLFACDVATGYRFFHNHVVIGKMWEIYSRATALGIGVLKLAPRRFRREPPYKVACITSMFSDYLAPVKTLVNFAINMDRSLFTPVMIITNQTNTMERRGEFQILPFHQTVLGKQLVDAGIDIAGIATQENVMRLSQYLVEICDQMEIDMMVTNGSPFSFPEACVARSGVVGASFDLHQGFPLYVDGMDAIMHFARSTREIQLGPWLAKGGTVIDYLDGIEIMALPEPRPAHDPAQVVFLTVSNYLGQRLSAEFCATVSRILRDCPQAVYRLAGPADQQEIAARFDPAVRNRLVFVGALTGREQTTAEYLQADIYLNEFPVSGVRVCLEAMCAELPVVTMVSGELHVNRTAADHVGEFALPQYDPEQYYQRVMRLVREPEWRRQVGGELRQRMETLYDYRKNFAELGRRMVEIYRNKLA